jgi:hypothetical protein
MILVLGIRNKPRWNQVESGVVTGMFSAPEKRGVSTKDISDCLGNR